MPEVVGQVYNGSKCIAEVDKDGSVHVLDQSIKEFGILLPLQLRTQYPDYWTQRPRPVVLPLDGQFSEIFLRHFTGVDPQKFDKLSHAPFAQFSFKPSDA